MNEITNWIQSNWYELGGLFVQLSFLAAAIWFGRKILRTMRASQEQVGALLRLSVSDAPPREAIDQRPPSGASVERGMSSAGFELPATRVIPPQQAFASNAAMEYSLTGASAYRPAQSERTPLTISEPVESGPGALASAWQGIGRWLQTPMSTRRISPWRRVVRWLQASAGS